MGCSGSAEFDVITSRGDVLKGETFWEAEAIDWRGAVTAGMSFDGQSILVCTSTGFCPSTGAWYACEMLDDS